MKKKVLALTLGLTMALSLAACGGNTGSSTSGSGAASSSAGSSSGETGAETEQHYVLNTNSKKFHLPDCSGVENMNPSNRQDYTGTRQSLLDQGYSPCGTCKP